jgi:predicted tellurium resistance membrane protein TerC
MDFAPDDLLSLLALLMMEIALGIDNVIFVSILAGKLPTALQGRVRRTWMVLGITMRLGLLTGLVVLVQILTAPLFTIDIASYHHEVTGKHVILLVGGLFLLVKAVLEIHEKLEGGADHDPDAVAPTKGFVAIMAQVMLIDAVFSIDSMVTAIGMSNKLWVMLLAVCISMGIMFVFAKRIGEFVMQHPTFKMLALSFLLLIGILLVAEGVGQHISKGYVYFAMAFAMGVELLNLRLRTALPAPVRLHMPDPDAIEGDSAGQVSPDLRRRVS